MRKLHTKPARTEGRTGRHKIAKGGMATRVYQARRPSGVRRHQDHAHHWRGPHRDQFVQRFHREAKSALSPTSYRTRYDVGEFSGLTIRHEYVCMAELTVRNEPVGARSAYAEHCVAGETLGWPLPRPNAVQAWCIVTSKPRENIPLNDRGHVQITDIRFGEASQPRCLRRGCAGTAAYLLPK